MQIFPELMREPYYQWLPFHSFTLFLTTIIMKIWGPKKPFGRFYKITQPLLEALQCFWVGDLFNKGLSCKESVCKYDSNRHFQSCSLKLRFIPLIPNSVDHFTKDKEGDHLPAGPPDNFQNGALGVGVIKKWSKLDLLNSLARSSHFLLLCGHLKKTCSMSSIPLLHCVQIMSLIVKVRALLPIKKPFWITRHTVTLVLLKAQLPQICFHNQIHQ